MDELPRRYAGVDVPHWEQYTGWWAMPLDRFDEMAAILRSADPTQHVLETQARADRRRKEIQAAQTWREDAAGDAAGYWKNDGVAVVDLVGVMTKYGGSFSAMPGGLVGLQRTLRQAAVDPDVRSIVLRVDSPGGNVSGTGDLAAQVGKINRQKPIVAFLEDLAASGAYYVASQARTIIATKDTLVGSIGVYMVIDDWSVFFAREQVKRHVIRAGIMKGAGLMGTEITPEQLADFQRMVDEINGVFVTAVAAGRAISAATAMEWADGRVHIASQAKTLGLIDQVGTLEEALAVARGLAAENSGPIKRKTMGTVPSADAGAQPFLKKEKTMSKESTGPATLAELKEAFPDALAEFRESCLEMEATLADAKDLWIDALRNKVKAQDAALKEATAKTAAIKPPGNAPVPSGGTTTAGTSANATAEWKDAVDEEISKGKGVSRDAAVRAVNQRRPGLRQDMLREHNTAHGRTKAAALVE